MSNNNELAIHPYLQLLRKVQDIDRLSRVSKK